MANKLKDDRKVMDGELMDAVVLLSVALKKKGKNCFILPSCKKPVPFPSTKEKVAQNSASHLQLWSLGTVTASLVHGQE